MDFNLVNHIFEANPSDQNIFRGRIFSLMSLTLDRKLAVFYPLLPSHGRQNNILRAQGDIETLSGALWSRKPFWKGCWVSAVTKNVEGWLRSNGASRQSTGISVDGSPITSDQQQILYYKKVDLPHNAVITRIQARRWDPSQIVASWKAEATSHCAELVWEHALPHDFPRLIRGLITGSDQGMQRRHGPLHKNSEAKSGFSAFIGVMSQHKKSLLGFLVIISAYTIAIQSQFSNAQESPRLSLQGRFWPGTNDAGDAFLPQAFGYIASQASQHRSQSTIRFLL